MSDGGDRKRRLIPSRCACRVNRRRCSLDCLFLQYFPPGTEAEFAAVLRFFGPTNFTKRVKRARKAGTPAEPAVVANRQHSAAASLTFEALARASDPVFGCSRIISDLQSFLDCLEAELQIVTDRLQHYRSGSAKAPVDSDTVSTSASAPGVEPNSRAESGPREWEPQELRRFYYRAPDIEQIMKDAQHEPLALGEINLPALQGLIPHSFVTAYRNLNIAQIYDDLLGPVNVDHGYEIGQPSSQESQENQDQNDPLEVNVPTTASPALPSPSSPPPLDADTAKSLGVTEEEVSVPSGSTPKQD